jgi:hypothetical protein
LPSIEFIFSASAIAVILLVLATYTNKRLQSDIRDFI